MPATKKKYPLACSICFRDIPETFAGWKDGNNAQPVNDGRCCQWCDDHVVIPARFNVLKRRFAEQRAREKH